MSPRSDPGRQTVLRKYTGRRWDAILIMGDQFTYRFYSDGSGVDWGYKFGHFPLLFFLHILALKLTVRMTQVHCSWYVQHLASHSTLVTRYFPLAGLSPRASMLHSACLCHVGQGLLFVYWRHSLAVLELLVQCVSP